MTPTEKLDAAFSLVIRLTNTDENGFGFCCTCGKPLYYKQGHCGHFMSRRHLSTRWEEKNCGLQCVSCNLFNQGKQFEFSMYLNRKYGPGTADLMLIKTRLVSKLGKWEIQQLTIYYQQKLDELKKSKNLRE